MQLIHRSLGRNILKNDDQHGTWENIQDLFLEDVRQEDEILFDIGGTKRPPEMVFHNFFVGFSSF